MSHFKEEISWGVRKTLPLMASLPGCGPLHQHKQDAGPLTLGRTGGWEWPAQSGHSAWSLAKGDKALALSPFIFISVLCIFFKTPSNHYKTPTKKHHTGPQAVKTRPSPHRGGAPARLPLAALSAPQAPELPSEQRFELWKALEGRPSCSLCISPWNILS